MGNLPRTTKKQCKMQRVPTWTTPPFASHPTKKNKVSPLAEEIVSSSWSSVIWEHRQNNRTYKQAQSLLTRKLRNKHLNSPNPNPPKNYQRHPNNILRVFAYLKNVEVGLEEWHLNLDTARIFEVQVVLLGLCAWNMFGQRQWRWRNVAWEFSPTKQLLLKGILFLPIPYTSKHLLRRYLDPWSHLLRVCF